MRRFTASSIVVLGIVVAVVVIASVLLAKTVTTAQRINDKAQNIAKTGRGINASTDSVIQLRRTNKLALSILRSARPLQGQLGSIVSVANGIDHEAGAIDGSAGTINTSATTINSTAHSINGEAGNINSSAGSISSSAGSINSSAGSVNSSAGSIRSSAVSINSSATGINGDAGSIVAVARRINTDVNLINTNLDVTIAIAKVVKGDTGNILGQALTARSNAACIDKKVVGAQGNDGQCQGTSTAAKKHVPAASIRGLTSGKGVSKLKHLAQKHALSQLLAPTQSAPAAAGQGSAPSSDQGTPASAPSQDQPPSGPLGGVNKLVNQLFG